MNDARTIQRIRFVAFDPEVHLGLLASWLALPDVAEWWPDTSYQLDQARHRRGDAQHRLILFDDRPVGYARWQRVDFLALPSMGLDSIPEGSVDFDVLVGEPALLGRGIGSAAVRLLCDELFLDESIPLVGTVTSTENHRAIRSFKKAGLTFLQEYDDERYGRCVVLARARPRPGHHAGSSAQARADAAAGSPGGLALQIEKVPEGQMDFLLDMMADFNTIEDLSWSRELVEPAVRTLLSSPDLGVVHYILEAGEVRGYFVLTWGFDLEWNGRDAFLTELYILAQSRGRGIGRHVLPQIEELAERHGARALHLMVRPENEPAVALYQGAGYECPPRLFLTKALPGGEAP
ncbi:MAG TPA: GNAT family N-acetyltransferase [Polyangiaceae bacterium]|nr:GNAT family N-acetyltransferase [Polyangiaceae bacterium]